MKSEIMKGLRISAMCLMTACTVLVFSGCDSNEEPDNTNTVRNVTQTIAPTETTADDGSITINGVRFSKSDLTDTWTEDTSTKITFNGDTAEITGTGAAQEGTKITISVAGTYILSGTWNDGQLIVDVSDTENVQLVMNGVTMNCSNSAPIHVKNSDNTVITLKEGTTNTFTDASSYVFEIPGSTKPNACIYSADDLTINGKGKMIVNANYNNGIGSNNDLKIISGDITVDAQNNALKGTDAISIKDGTVNVKSVDDGLKSDNEVEADRGCVNIFAGTISIEAGDDCIQAYTSINITGGKITAKFGGKTVNCDGEVNVVEGAILT